MNNQKIQDIYDFIVKLDQLKNVDRRTKVISSTRRENSAEHSWHVAISAYLLKELANFEIDIDRVIKMLMFHDVAEIELGDTFHYFKDANRDLEKNEILTLSGMINFMKPENRSEIVDLVIEFQQKITAESKYANAIDRFMAFVSNLNSSTGGTWFEYGISYDEVISKNEHIRDGSEALWYFLKEKLDILYKQI